MAQLFLCNNGEIDLQQGTMDVLKAMPRAWAVLLNGRLANPGSSDREFDALVVTEKALHVIGFEFSRGPVSIESEALWQCDGARMESGFHRESPQKQVVMTADALREVLDRRVPGFHRELAPWVVLENPNPANRYGGQPFRPHDHHRSGITWIVNGAAALSTLISRREESENRLGRAELPDITAADRGQLTKLFGAQRIGRMSIAGRVMTLSPISEARALPDVQIALELNGSPHGSDVRTDQEGCFEFLNLPVHPFRLAAQAGKSDLRFMGTEQRAPRPGFASVAMYALEPGLTRDQVASLVDRQLDQARKELEREHQAFEHRLRQLEAERLDFERRLGDHQERLLELMEKGVRGGREEDDLREGIAELRAALLRNDALGETDLSNYVNSAVDEIQRDIEGLRKGVEAAEAAQPVGKYHMERARAERETRDDEAHAAVASTEARRRLRESLGWSVIVGGAGGVISLQPIPFADNFILASMQLALVLKIGKIYGKDFTSDLAYKLIAAVGGGQLAQHGTVLLHKLIPGAWALSTVPVHTTLLGYLTAVYFEQGTKATKEERSDILGALKRGFRDEELRIEVREIGRYLVDEYRRASKELKREAQSDWTRFLYEELEEVGSELTQRAQRVADRLLGLIESKTDEDK